MEHPIRIEYPIAHRLAQQQRGQSTLDPELPLDRQVLGGVLTSADWLRFEHLPWSFENGTAVLRSDTITARSTLSGHATATINVIAKIEVVFSIDECARAWVATTIYTDPLDILEDLAKTIATNFSPEKQVATGGRIGDVLTRLYAEWDLPGLEEKLTEYAGSLCAIVKDFHPQWNDMHWTVCAPGADPLPSGGYSWRGKSSLFIEALRLLYYLTQSFSFIDHNKGTLWIKPAALVKDIDLAFLHLRLFSSGHAHQSAATTPKIRSPDDVAPEVTRWINDLTSFAQDAVPTEVRQLVWHSAVLIDSLPAVTMDLPLEWSAIEMRGILCDTRYREKLIGAVPLGAVVEGSVLERTLQFWTEGAVARPGANVNHSITQAWRLVRDYFAWLDARKLGLSLPAVQVFHEEDVSSLRRRLQGSENLKKIEPLLTLLDDVGPTKYSAHAPLPEVLAGLAVRFPNFKALIAMLQKQLRLAKRQSNPMLHLHPILIVGDPGWGKTRFLSALAGALGLPHTEIPMASMTAGFVLGGGDTMWHSAKPGKIADLFIHGSCINPMVVLDELDKGGKDASHDSYGPLYSLLERHTAARFVDEALAIPLDTQHICWFATANSVSAIPAPILDRFEVFETGTLTPSESAMVAQSVYTDLLLEHSWGSAFTPDLDPAVARLLQGQNARQMHRSLRDACANAAARDDVILTVTPVDVNTSIPRKGIGF